MNKICGPNNLLIKEYQIFINELKEQSLNECDAKEVCDCIKKLVSDGLIIITDRLSDNNINAYLTQRNYNPDSTYNYHGCEVSEYIFDYYQISTCPICGNKIELSKNAKLQRTDISKI